MGQNKRADHDSALDDRVGDPGGETRSEGRQSVDEGGTVDKGSNGGHILQKYMMDLAVFRTKRWAGIASLISLMVHGDIVSLEQRLGLGLVVSYDALSNLGINNIRRRHVDLVA